MIFVVYYLNEHFFHKKLRKCTKFNHDKLLLLAIPLRVPITYLTIIAWIC